MRIMTDEMHRFLLDNVRGLSNIELTELVNKTFGTSIAVNQIKSYKGNHHIQSGLTGRFVKGQKAHNKGVKVKEETYAKCQKTMFKKGNVPVNHRSVGSERINKYGYIEIKVAEPSRWRLKHRVVWEEVNGCVTHGKCIIFLNGEKTDVRIDNLALIDREVNLRMNQSGLRFEDANTTRVATRVCELISAVGKAKKKIRS